MTGENVNRISGRVLMVLSLIALGTVCTGYFQAPHQDEGAAVHIFQLSVVALLPTILVYLATVDRRAGLQSLRALAFSAATMIVAFGALYYLEHFYYASHYR